MQFDHVSLSDVRSGVQDFLKKGQPEGFGNAAYFDVEVGGKLFPPKVIMAYANFHATGQLPKNNFKGGRNTPCFKAFERLGITIHPRSNPKGLTDFIDQYKKLIKGQLPEHQFEGKYNELYKWETVQWFQDHWTDEHTAESLPAVLEKSFNKRGSNLWSGAHYFPFGMLTDMAKTHPSELSGMFRNLFNEDVGLNERLQAFESFGEQYITKHRPDVKNHYQSRRAMMVYLTLRYPEKYVFYKKGMFDDFCNFTKFWPPFGRANKGDYSVIMDFLEMCGHLKDVLESDLELLACHRARLPETITFDDGDNLLIQDFMYAVTTYLNVSEGKASKGSSEMNRNEMKERFGRWLSDVQSFKKSSRDSYLRAIDILEVQFGISVYREQSVGRLELLYQDLIAHQADEQGKYYFPDALSYGEHGYYSAAIIQFMRFLDVKEMSANDSDLNQIFFGPPGTGKTYNTINEALKIVDPEFYAVQKDDRSALLARFQELQLNDENEAQGQIGFATFHQSMSYEDFIEGIKPSPPEAGDEFLKYAIEDGIFKNMCRIASDSLSTSPVEPTLSLTESQFKEAEFYKTSLGNTRDRDDDEVYDYCIENGFICLGFGGGLDYSGKSEADIRKIGVQEGLGTYDVTAMNLFVNHLKEGSFVVVSNGNRYVRAIGKVTGPYEFKEQSPFPNNPHWNHFRQVDWSYAGKDIPSGELYNKNLSQMTIYKMDKREVNPAFFLREKDDLAQKKSKNYVLIIDEINRGNVSAIFGELITLIEPNKRAGQREALSATLPYSKATFSVPSNLHIIGTMNTADRSVEALDSALRRRFSFKEMAPDSTIIANQGKLKSSKGVIKPEGIDLPRMLDAINRRIELLRDKDYRIGHSYLMEVETVQDLKVAFKDKIIPLLEEYFFSDMGKLSLILGGKFIEPSEAQTESVFAGNHGYDEVLVNELLERRVYHIAPEEKWDFKSIYAS